MSLMGEVAQLLEDAELGTAGVDLFVFNMPENIKRCLLVIESVDGVPRDEYLPGLKRVDFKVVVRNPEYESALTIAKGVIEALDLHRLNVGDFMIDRMRATHDPIPFPVPDSDVIEVSVNMWARFTEL